MSWIFVFLFSSILFNISQTRRPLIQWQLGDPPVDEITWMCVKRLKASTNWIRLASEGFPKKVSTKNTRCSWKIQAPPKKRIRLSFRGMSLRSTDPTGCPDNYVLVIDENIGRYQQRVCGKTPPEYDIVSSKNSIRIDFQIDMAIVGDSRGFSLSFKQTTEKPGFYEKNPPTTTTNRPMMTFSSRTVGSDYQRNEKKSGLDINLIIIVAASIILVLILVYFLWMRKKQKKKEKKIEEQKKKNEKEKKKEIECDPDLPKNEIDPFERVAAACAPLKDTTPQNVEEPIYENFINDSQQTQAPVIPPKKPPAIPPKQLIYNRNVNCTLPNSAADIQRLPASRTAKKQRRSRTMQHPSDLGRSFRPYRPEGRYSPVDDFYETNPNSKSLHRDARLPGLHSDQIFK